MSEDRIELEPGLEVIPSVEPGRFLYVPRVVPERNASGQPTLLLLRSGVGGTLQFGAQLEIDEARVEKARSALKAKYRTEVMVDRPNVNVQTARVLLTSANGDNELQSTSVSNLPGNQAIFRISLTAEQLKLVEEALRGTKERLQVVYDFELLTSAGVSVLVEGSPTEAVAALPPDPSESDALSSLERAIAHGEIKVERQQFGFLPGNLIETATADAKSKAARLLLHFEPQTLRFSGERSDSVLSDIQLQEPRTIRTQQTSDIADWFHDTLQPTILGASSQAAPQPRSGLVKISLAFDPKDLPIAFVELRTSGAPAVLRGPAWASVFLTASDNLEIKTNYTAGAPPFVVQVPLAASGERSLLLQELGIVKVAIDASARKAAGARKLTGNVDYVREGQTLDTFPLRFQFGDWTEEWVLVTGATSLNGLLRCTWEETDAEGSTSHGGPVESQTSSLSLTEINAKPAIAP